MEFSEYTPPKNWNQLDFQLEEYTPPKNWNQLEFIGSSATILQPTIIVANSTSFSINESISVSESPGVTPSFSTLLDSDDNRKIVANTTITKSEIAGPKITDDNVTVHSSTSVGYFNVDTVDSSENSTALEDDNVYGAITTVLESLEKSIENVSDITTIETISSTIIQSSEYSFDLIGSSIYSSSGIVYSLEEVGKYIDDSIPSESLISTNRINETAITVLDTNINNYVSITYNSSEISNTFEDNLVYSISAYPINDVENQPTIYPTVTSSVSTSINSEEVTRELIDANVTNTVPTIIFEDGNGISTLALVNETIYSTINNVEEKGSRTLDSLVELQSSTIFNIEESSVGELSTIIEKSNTYPINDVENQPTIYPTVTSSVSTSSTTKENALTNLVPQIGEYTTTIFITNGSGITISSDVVYIKSHSLVEDVKDSNSIAYDECSISVSKISSIGSEEYTSTIEKDDVFNASVYPINNVENQPTIYPVVESFASTSLNTVETGIELLDGNINSRKSTINFINGTGVTQGISINPVTSSNIEEGIEKGIEQNEAVSTLSNGTLLISSEYSSAIFEPSVYKSNGISLESFDRRVKRFDSKQTNSFSYSLHTNDSGKAILETGIHSTKTIIYLANKKWITEATVTKNDAFSQKSGEYSKSIDKSIETLVQGIILEGVADNILWRIRDIVFDLSVMKSIKTGGINTQTTSYFDVSENSIVSKYNINTEKDINFDNIVVKKIS